MRPERAVRFYRDTLGLRQKYRFPDYAGFDCGGVEIGLKTWGGSAQPRLGEPSIDLLVDDIDDAHRTLVAKGVRFRKSPEDAQWGARIACFTDPDGNKLQLTQIDWPRYFEANVPHA